MQTDRTNAAMLLGGMLLISMGFLALTCQLSRALSWDLFWPFTFMILGSLFFVAMLFTGKKAAGLAIPGSTIGGIGLVILFQALTGHAGILPYFWTLVIFFVGVGIYLMGCLTGDTKQKHAGLRVTKAGFILLIIFGAFFEMVYSGFHNAIFPVLLISAGAYVVLSRSGRFGLKKKESSDLVSAAH